MSKWKRLQVDRCRRSGSQGGRSRPRTYQALSFQTLSRPKLPELPDSGTPANPIDAFVCAKRSERNLTHMPAAEPGVLLRRVYLDLVGVPRAPTSYWNTSRIRRTKLISKRSIDCSRRLSMENVGAGIGWTFGVTATGMVAARCLTL